MKTLIVQFQPHWVPELDESKVKKLLSTIGSKSELVKSFRLSEGTDETRYLEFRYTTDDPSGLWTLIRKKALENSTIGSKLKKSTIIVGEGESGWDDYLLLHHFNKRQMVRATWEADDEKRVIKNIEKYGWHLVSIEDDDEGPGFVFSVGLYHTLGQPEIIMFGLKDVKTMGQIINGIGDEMRKGEKFEDWMESEKILQNYLCIFRQVDQNFYDEYLGYGLWYYLGNEFPVLQCVWPDREGRYPWHPDFPAELHKRQPVLARKSPWRFHEGKNRTVFTTNRVVEGKRPILLVTHDEDDDWQFLCGTTNKSKDCRLVCLSCIVEKHPEILKLAGLPIGWRAERAGVNKPWRRTKIPSKI